MFRKLLLAALTTLALSGVSHAATLVGLQGDQTLLTIDSDARRVTATVQVTDIRLAGIDVRPADGMLYGLGVDGRIVTIDPQTGRITEKARITEALDPAVRYTVDFNPVADRMRVLGSNGVSLRINVDNGQTIVDGRLRYAEQDANRAATPRVVAGAYSNSFRGTQATTLYDLDAATQSFLRQVPPNDGILNTIGRVEIPMDGMVAFDIASDGQGGNVGWIVAGATLLNIDISNGQTRSLGTIAGLSGGLLDVAVIRN